MLRMCIRRFLAGENGEGSQRETGDGSLSPSSGVRRQRTVPRLPLDLLLEENRRTDTYVQYDGLVAIIYLCGAVGPVFESAGDRSR